MDEAQARSLAAEALAGIAPEADLSTVGEDEDLREALDLDSKDIFNLVIALSQRLMVEIPDADAGRIVTLNGGIAYLIAKLS